MLTAVILVLIFYVIAFLLLDLITLTQPKRKLFSALIIIIGLLWLLKEFTNFRF